HLSVMATRACISNAQSCASARKHSTTAQPPVAAARQASRDSVAARRAARLLAESQSLIRLPRFQSSRNLLLQALSPALYLRNGQCDRRPAREHSPAQYSRADAGSE